MSDDIPAVRYLTAPAYTPDNLSPFGSRVQIRRLPQPVVELSSGRKILENILFTIYTIGFLLGLGLLVGVLTGGIVPLLGMWPH